MAVRTFAVAGFTTDAVADVVDLTDSKFMALQGASSTQRTKIKEVYVAGLESSSSAPQKLLLARDGTIAGATITALTTGESDEADDPATAALAAPVVSFVATGGTQPQRAKKYLQSLGLNALGGITRIRFPHGEEPTMLGNTASNGEVSLSGFTGTTAGAITASIKYETLAYVIALIGLSGLA